MRIFVEKYYEDQQRLLLRKIGGRGIRKPDQMDILQETFCRALTYINTFQESKGPFAAWFNTLMNNVIKDFKRDEKLQGMVREMKATDPEEDPEFTKIMALRLGEEVGDMSEKNRYVLELKYIHNLQNAEIVHLVDNNIRSIETIIDRFKTKMKGKYKEADGG